MRFGDIDVLLASVEVLVCADLAARGSGLVISGRLDETFAENCRSILREAVDSAVSSPKATVDAVTVDYEDREVALRRTGELRATQDRHPAESLMAAEVLFSVAIPQLVAFVDAVWPSSANGLNCATALHHAIWRRFPPGAIAYVEVILQRLSNANHESRLQVSREIHDRISHGIVAGIQRIELVEHTPAAEVSLVLEGAISALRSALREAQEIAVTLRLRVRGASLDEALQDFVRNLAPRSLPTEFIRVGVPVGIKETVAEELLMIIIEATRNAHRHAVGATRCEIVLAYSPRVLVATVMDNGKGFDSQIIPSTSIGISSMRERTSLIGGDFSLETRAAFTKMTVTVPTL